MNSQDISSENRTGEEARILTYDDGSEMYNSLEFNRNSAEEHTLPKVHLHDNPEALDIQNSLVLDWVFGINKDIVGGVHNLSDENRKDIFYVSGHIGVIYKVELRQQILLQGHIHPISCTSVSADKRWIVTADAGLKNMLVVWDSVKGIPIKTIFEPHAAGIQSVDISPDSMYIATLSLPDENDQQELLIWAWTSEDSSPLYSSFVPLSQYSTNLTHDSPRNMTEAANIHDMSKKTLFQSWVKFHDTNPKILVTNGPRVITFWSWQEGELVFYNPSVTSKDFRQAVGEFSVTCFVPNTSLAATGTKEGEVILWQKLNEQSDIEHEKRSFKVVKIHPNSSVNFVTCTKDYIVTGGEDGHVRFLDHQLRLEAWYEEFMAGPIMSISFNKVHVSEDDSLMDFDQSDSGTISRQKFRNPQEEFSCPDFIVSTGLAFIIRAEAKAFNDYRQKNLRGELVVLGQEGAINSLATHPKKHCIVISGASGHIHLWDYQLKKVVKITELASLSVSAMAFDAKGEYLVVGCTNGVVKILDGEQIEELQHFRPSHAAILDIKFSHDSLFIAYSDSDNAVGILKWDHRDQNAAKEVEWIYLGRFKSHKKPISGLEFGMVPFGDVARLMSVGEDRRLIEYDLVNSSIEGGIKLKAVHLVAQSSIPTSFLWTRVHITERYKNEPKEFDTLLFADNHYKVTEFITPDSNRDTQCLKTKTGPTFGGPLNRMILVPNPSGDPKDPQRIKFMAYTTHERVVGLIHLLINGDQNRYMGLIAHSGQVSSCTVSSDGRYLFTAGGTDCTVNQWAINGHYLEKASQISSDENIKPFIEQIEGGSQGEFFQEIKHMFYYAQIRSQGEITTKERKITGEVALDQIPNLMRSIGFYASNWEIYNIVNELKMIVGDDDEDANSGGGEPDKNPSSSESARKAPLLNMDDTFVDFDTFIRIYVNHRPLFDIEAQDVEQAFVTLGAEPNTGVIRRDQLMEKLNTMGERISDEEILHCLSTLQGEEMHISSIGNRLTASSFANWLGFEYGDASTVNTQDAEMEPTVREKNDQEEGENEEIYDSSDDENGTP